MRITKTRPGSYFSDNDIEKITAGAFDILMEIGVKITDTNVIKKLVNMGFTEKDQRILITSDDSSKFLAEVREREKKKPFLEAEEKDTAAFDGWINPYTHHYLDIETEEFLPYDTYSLTEMTRFIEKVSREKGITPGIPGYPSDVPPQLESLARYKISAENCSRGWCADPTSRLSAKYMFEMAQVMGQDIPELSVFMASPLCLGDESFHIVLDMKDKISSVRVTSMPCFGVNTPMSVNAAFSLSLAEVMGGAFIMQQLTGLPANFFIQMYPFDFRALNMIFGSPEKLLLEWMMMEFNAKLFEKPFAVARTNIHTWAKKPGAQSAFEKGSLMAAGAVNGAVYFEGLGTLSLDEIFSPVQLLLDIEMLKHNERLVSGIKKDEEVCDLLNEVRKGLNGGFVNSDLTLDNYSEHIWNSQLFDRSSYNTWNASGRKESLDIARQTVHEFARKPIAFEIDPIKRRELESIYSRAQQEYMR